MMGFTEKINNHHDDFGRIDWDAGRVQEGWAYVLGMRCGMMALHMPFAVCSLDFLQLWLTYTHTLSWWKIYSFLYYFYFYPYSVLIFLFLWLFIYLFIWFLFILLSKSASREVLLRDSKLIAQPVILREKREFDMKHPLSDFSDFSDFFCILGLVWFPSCTTSKHSLVSACSLLILV